MENNHITNDLRRRVRVYMLYKRDARIMESSKSLKHLSPALLKHLSPALLHEILLSKYQNILRNIPQFQVAPNTFLASIAELFHTGS